MKKSTIFLLGIVLSINIYSQVPQSFNYQAVLDDGSISTGIYKKGTVAVIVKIKQGTPEGLTVVEEVHSTTINEKGLFSIQIGTVNTDDFSAIDWANGPYYLNINVNGTDFGTSQLLSVPYAVYAAESGDTFSGNFGDLTNVPSEFTPVTHSHTEADVTDLQHYTDGDIQGDEDAFNGWDKNAEDDFNGDYSSLSNTP